MRATVSLLLLLAASAAAAAAQAPIAPAPPRPATGDGAASAPAPARDSDADDALLPDDPEVAEWYTREGKSELRSTRAIHAGSSGLLHSFEMGTSGQFDVPAAVIAWPDRRTYDTGDTATVYVRNVGTVPGYVAVFRVDATGEAHVLFPLAPADDNYVSQQQTIAVRALPSGATFAVDSAEGTSLVYAVISRDPLDFYAYSQHGAWNAAAPPRVEAPPSDAVTDHWGKLYWELSGIAQRMSSAFSAHLVTYDVSPRASVTLTPAMMAVQMAAYQSTVPSAVYLGMYPLAGYFHGPGFSYAHASSQEGGMLDRCFDVNGNPTFDGPWCAWQTQWYGITTPRPNCPQLQMGQPCVSNYLSTRGGNGGSSPNGGRGTQSSTAPGSTPPHSTDVAGAHGKGSGAGGGGAPPPGYIISAFKHRPSAAAPSNAPAGGGGPGTPGTPHGGPPASVSGAHLAPPVVGGFTPPAVSNGARGAGSGGGGVVRSSAPAVSGGMPAGGGSAPVKRVTPPPPPPPPPAGKPPAR